MKPCSTEFVAWCAGFFDAEGTISISRHDKKRVNSSPSFVLTAVCYQTERAPLDAMTQTFGGKLYYSSLRIWVWSVGARSAEDFLRAIRPYCRTKRPEIDIALRFRKTFEGRWNQRVERALVREREQYRQALISYRTEKYAKTRVPKEERKKTAAPPRSKQFLAWCAGFFDGDGTIGIMQNVDKSRRRAGQNPSLRHSLQVITYQTQREPLDAMCDVFGGGVYKQKNRVYAWHVGACVAEAFLVAVRPYVRVKGPEIDIALEFRETFEGRGTTRLSEQLLRKREKLRTALNGYRKAKYAKNRKYARSQR
ncbi:MAG: LAGLIDADG family homing endonuclease [Tepidisphaeraceae bacterium]